MKRMKLKTHIIHDQPETEVYVGSKGHVVVMQPNPEGGNNDTSVHFRPSEIPQLVKHLKAVQREALDCIKEAEVIPDQGKAITLGIPAQLD